VVVLAAVRRGPRRLADLAFGQACLNWRCRDREASRRTPAQSGNHELGCPTREEERRPAGLQASALRGHVRVRNGRPLRTRAGAGGRHHADDRPDREAGKNGEGKDRRSRRCACERSSSSATTRRPTGHGRSRRTTGVSRRRTRQLDVDSLRLAALETALAKSTRPLNQLVFVSQVDNAEASGRGGGNLLGQKGDNDAAFCGICEQRREVRKEESRFNDPASPGQGIRPFEGATSLLVRRWPG